VACSIDYGDDWEFEGQSDAESEGQSDAESESQSDAESECQSDATAEWQLDYPAQVSARISGNHDAVVRASVTTISLSDDSDDSDMATISTRGQHNESACGLAVQKKLAVPESESSSSDEYDMEDYQADYHRQRNSYYSSSEEEYYSDEVGCMRQRYGYRRW
jgi:hypothetical protein